MGALSPGQLCREGQGGARLAVVGAVEEVKDPCDQVTQARAGELRWGSRVGADGVERTQRALPACWTLPTRRKVSLKPQKLRKRSSL